MPDKDDLKEQRDRFLGFAFAASDLLLEVGKDNRVDYVVGAAKGLTGIDENSLTGRIWTDIFLEKDKGFLKAMIDQAQTGKRCGPVLSTIQDNYRRKSENVILAAIKMPGKDCTYITISFSNELMNHLGFEHRQQEEDMMLLNREDFAQEAKQALSTASEMGQDVDLTLFDLIGLESVRDRLSDERWDHLMSVLTGMLKSRSLDGQIATKISDSKYGLLHDKRTEIGNIEEEISNLIKQNDPNGMGVKIEGNSVDASLGSLNEKEASRALIYTLKEFEKDGSSLTVKTLQDGFKHFLDANAEKIQQFKTITKKLDFHLHFQPIVSLTTLDISHYEMLTRFRDGSSPYEMITFGEDVGLAADFDMAVCERAFLYIGNSSKDSSQSYAINISGQSIENDAFFKAFHGMLQEKKEYARRILFEITESASIKDLEKVNKFIKTLQKDGYRVCLDDFGAGASSFQYLHNLHVDYVKLDGLYTQQLFYSKRNETMIRHVANLCKDLDVKMVAERIETEEEARLLRRIRVGYGQGYWFSKPLPKPEYKKDTDKLYKIEY